METPVFVGREAQLQRLDDFLAAALAGQGQVCFVAGEAGSGKTALVTEFARRAEAEHPDLVAAAGQADAQTGIGDPYLPFREVLGLLTGGDVAERGRSISPENAGRLRKLVGVSARFLVELAPELVALLVPGAGLALKAAKATADQAGWLGKLEQLAQQPRPGAEPGAAPDQDVVFEQYTRFVTGLAAEKPLLLILDDLQWADPSSLALLFRLGRRTGQSRVFIIGTYRPEEIAREAGRHPLEKVITELKRYQGEIELSLDAAAAAERRAFVDSLLDSEPNVLDETFRSALFERTDGQALFTVELLRAMQERGDLVRDAAGRWAPGPSLDWDALPARVEGVIEERIARLAADLRAALTVASVEGEEFTAEVLAQVQKEEVRGLVRRLSEELQREHRLVRAEGLRQLDARRLALYRFQHTLFQRFLYNGLDPVERAYLHEDVGNALEALYGGQAGEVAVQLAWHFEQAGIASKAARYLRLSAEKALATGAFREAVEHARRGLALLPAASPDRPRLQEVFGRALYYSGELDAARAQLEPALAAAEAAGEVRVRVAAVNFLGWIATDQGDYPAARDYLAAAAALARQLGNQSGMADALRSLGAAEFRQGAYAEAEAHALESRAMFESLGDRRGMAKAADLLAAVARETGDYERALGIYREAQALLQDTGAAGAEATLLNNMGDLARAKGDYAQAQRDYQESGVRSAKLGDLLGIAVVSLNLGHTAARSGDDAAARVRFHEALRLAREMAVVPVQLDALAGLAGVLARAGEIDRPLEILGLIENHPALAGETRPAVEQGLAVLRTRCSEEQIAAGLARGKALRLDEVVAEVLGRGER
ncbi:MAG: ATP-binding protein [Nitrososphaerales archaeon]